jgi:hypothetical protein
MQVRNESQKRRHGSNAPHLNLAPPLLARQAARVITPRANTRWPILRAAAVPAQPRLVFRQAIRCIGPTICAAARPVPLRGLRGRRAE